MSADAEEAAEREAIRAEACGEDLEPDVEQARVFIAALTGDPEAPMTWQTFDDSDLKRGDLGRVLHGTVKELFPQLVARNRRGAGIFLMVNAGDSKGPRKAENVVALRALFTDHDAPGSPVSPLPPSFTCSGRAYGHRYWRLKPGEPLGRFAGAQKALAAYYHSDAAVHDLARVMRVPGFFNEKHGGRFPVRFEPGSGNVYTIDEVLAAHPVSDTRATATVRMTPSAKLRVGPGQRHATLTHFAAQMRRDGLAGRPIHAALRALADESFDLSDGRTVPDSEIADVVAWIDQRDGDPPPRYATEAPKAEGEPSDPAPFPSDWLRPGAGLAARPAPMARVPLSAILPTLHENTRGGLPTGSVVCLQGPPDSAKTGVAQTIADEAERRGWTVVHLSNDNGREPAEIRYGQLMGFDRTRLEEGDPEEVSKFRAAFAGRNILMPDPDRCDENLEPVNTLSHVIDEAKRSFPIARVLLLVDSIQAVVPDTGKYESPRLRVVATMKLLRKAANVVPGWIVVAPSQINREAFKNKKESKNTDPLTAGAESGSIEFGSDLMLYLSPTEEGIRVQVTKNKPGAGRRPTFPIVWDRERARASEPDAASFEAEAFKIAAQTREQLETKIEAIVRTEAGLSTQRVQQKARGHRESEVADALGRMADAAPPRLICKKKGNGRYWYPPEYSAREIG